MGSTPLRWSLIGLAALLIAVVTAAVTAIVVLVIVFDRSIDRRGAAALTRGLSGNWADMSHEFDRRVRVRFPVGSMVRDMAWELEVENFHQDDWLRDADPEIQADEHVAIRKESDFVCGEFVAVYWRQDARGLLKSVRGTYSEAGCL